MIKSSYLAVLLAALFVSIPVSAQTVKIATAEELSRDVKLVPCAGADRLDAVQKLFISMGAQPSDISVEDRKGTKNLIVTKKGTSSDVIIVSAHYDKVDEGCGAIDNWTGIVAIAHLYETLRNVQTAKTFKFIAFDKEEKGLVGSDNFVSAISKEDRGTVCSMVNVDSLGFTLPWVLENVSDKSLVAAAKDVWKRANVELPVVPVGNADADSTSFKRAGIPAITFTGLNSDWQKYLHSSSDQLKNVKMESVYAGYRFLLPFLSAIDKPACDAYRKK